ncbi:type I secretion system membrane fusion protein PrsE [Variibacter gotjawalensis]|uniref:Membrane fusion protein (MFP) family protein n=1 Tax=Variibacter gotjawalensis TaxID=1333996 RepID=A0A0S3PNN7_9BRAD|nr:HlyD family type I secretion periplasmic adaptor subunit [Variibacter gotjawalensis]NIK47878.1 HlyD family secretion protein [Variibacter gotjawalensis]RZS49757.1 HlyD family secretion protein [Variibacter gotjawalensis]BAT57586.1 type I secretion system membrane fusion protein PrsE [Variibacter gotjawalensis]
MTETKPKASSEWRGVAIAGYSLIFAIFGIAGGWAAVTNIDQASIAQGVVSIETNRKTVQHYEGGIVREIFVKEGDVVSEQQVLLRLEKTQAEANSGTLAFQYFSARAIEARLLAERSRAAKIEWPADLKQEAETSLQHLKNVMADQESQFVERRASIDGQISVLNSRIEQLNTQISGTRKEQESAEEQVQFINKELVGVRDLAAKNLIPISRLYSLERERARLDGIIGRAISDIAKAEAQLGETKIQIQQLWQKFQEDVAAQLVDVRQKVSDLGEKLSVARDVLKRVEIRAPRSGTVQNLKVFTLGQVLRSGEPLLDIVPQDEPLVISAQFSPTDIDGVFAGQSAEIRFSSFHGSIIPVMIGTLQSISHDRLVDEATKQPYYLGIVSIDRAQIPEEYRTRIRSGMPAEVMVALGERTVFKYITAPLVRRLERTFREK